MRKRVWILAAAGLCGVICGPVSVRATGLGGDLKQRADRYDPLVQRIAGRYAVEPSLVHSIIAAESAYNRFAVSSKGAQGLMQLMPETAKDYGVEDSFDIEQNIEGGVKYLKALQNSYPGRTDLVLAAYNAGPGAVDKYDGVPPYAETKTYVAKVKSYLKQIPAKKRTSFYEYVDAEGRLRQTNDPRLAYR